MLLLLQAQQRGIVVSQTSGLPVPDYTNLISCRVEWKGGSRAIAATLFNDDEPRLVQIDGYRVDVRPEGIILVTHSHDQPGFIGRVGPLLGEHGINIADMRPQTETSHCAARPARFALEMNKGWFEKRGIAAGTPVGGLQVFSEAAH